MSVYSYEQVRDLIQDGDIVFFHGDWKQPIQAIVMFFTGSQFSHCAIAFWIKTKAGRRLLIVEAQGKTRRRILTLSYYADRLMTVVSAPKPWGNVEEIALERVGRAQYGWLEAIYVGMKEFLQKYFEINIPNLTLPHETCSEFVAEVYQLSNKRVSPQSLFEQLTETQQVRIETEA